MKHELSLAALIATLAMLPQLTSAQSPSAASGQNFPTKSVRIIVPLTPGGASDIVSRAVAQRLGENLGRPFLVDNRPGAGGTVAGILTTRAAPDGYTILLVPLSTLIASTMLDRLPYDLVKDFAPIILLATAPQVLVTHPSVTAGTVEELITLAKARPSKLNYGSSGIGGGTHLIGELFKMAAGIDIVHIPYKGSQPALIDLIGGKIDLLFSALISALPYVKSQRANALAVTSARRSSVLPDVPTMIEGGLAGFEATSWYGLVVPAATPRDLVVKLNHEIARILATSEFGQLLAADGAEVAGGTPEQFGAHIRREIAKWTRVVKEAKIRVQ